MTRERVVIGTKLTKDEYEKWQILKEFLVKLGYIDSPSDYKALRFCISFTMDAVSKALDNVLNQGNLAR